MLNLSLTRISDSHEVPVHSLHPVVAEGLALQTYFENGIGKCGPTSGALATDIFLGVSLSQNISASDAVNVEDVRVPLTAPYTVILTRTPQAANVVSVKPDAGGAAYTNVAAGSEAANKFSLTGATLTFDPAGSAAGLSFTVTYRFNLTIAESEYRYGDQPFGRTASQVLSSVGVIRRGNIFTDAFDTSIDWSTVTVANTIVGGANGRFTVGTGAIVQGGSIIQVPTLDVPFLGIRINAA